MKRKVKETVPPLPCYLRNMSLPGFVALCVTKAQQLCHVNRLWSLVIYSTKVKKTTTFKCVNNIKFHFITDLKSGHCVFTNKEIIYNKKKERKKEGLEIT